MIVEWAVLAEFARSNPDSGTIDILGGGIGKVYAPTFPYIHSVIAMGMWLRLSPKEIDQSLDIRVEIVDGAGEVIIDPLIGRLTIQRNLMEPNAPLTMPFTVAFQRLYFPRAGRYEFRFLVNDHIEATVPLLVRAELNEIARA